MSYRRRIGSLVHLLAVSAVAVAAVGSLTPLVVWHVVEGIPLATVIARSWWVMLPAFPAVLLVGMALAGGA